MCTSYQYNEVPQGEVTQLVKTDSHSNPYGHPTIAETEDGLSFRSPVKETKNMAYEIEAETFDALLESSDVEVAHN